ncbi:MAG: GBS Bsp-like repeat-containing protein, partial [Bacilli bacterium]
MERIATKKIRILGLFFVLLLFMSLCFLEHPVSAKSPVVVINAGHLAGSDSGAVGNGYREVDLNNALAVKTANTLKNAGYIVYLTHPIPGSDGISTLLNEPCSIGTTMKKAINAINPDLVLSVHHNSGGNSSGYQLYWSSARLDLDQVGIYEQGGLWADGSMSWMDSSPCSEAQNSLKMANILNNKFKGLGYVGPNGNNPIHERDDFIPSQSHAPAVLIEAGFISNSVEANRLADGNNQQKMANSITDSVNEFFGGSPTKDKTPPKAESVTNENSPTTDTIFTVYANGVTDTDTGVKKTSFAVWTTDNGQDDLKWHEGTYCGNNQWKVSVPIAEHGMELGLYVIDPYAEDYAGNQGSLGRTIIEVVRNSNISDGVSIEKINNEVFKVYAKGFSGYSEIVFPVWSENNGQDDIIWYSGIKQTDGSYASTVHTKEHGYDTGIYNAHVYGRNSSGVLVGLGGTSTTVSQMTAESVTASEVKDGKFKVTVSGINAPLGIRDIMIPVWSDHGGQDDIIWYTASKTSNDTYELTVDIKNHGYDTGEYIAHVYGT